MRAFSLARPLTALLPMSRGLGRSGERPYRTQPASLKRPCLSTHRKVALRLNYHETIAGGASMRVARKARYNRGHEHKGDTIRA